MIKKYICKIATLEELTKKADYEINRHQGNMMWEEFKNRAIKNFNEGNTITYIGILDNEIICEATAIINENGFIGDIEDITGLLVEGRAYLSGFRTNKEYEGQGYFSKLFHYMEKDLKEKGYTSLSLGVSPEEKRNCLIYEKWGFTNFIKTTTETYPPKDENSKPMTETANYYYKNI